MGVNWWYNRRSCLKRKTGHASEEPGVMRKIRDSSEDEMIAVYVQTEANSSRFRADIQAHARRERIDPRILHTPDWRDAQENASRRAILGAHRGYGRNEGFFQGFPADVRWERVALTREELEQVRYIDY